MYIVLITRTEYRGL